MKKLLLFCSLLLAGSTGATSVATATYATASGIEARAATVYICNNGKTAVYHSGMDCSAMKRCTHETVTTTEAKAQGAGKRRCMKCF
ncbi:hypothetical protein MUN82_10055 [Hymenobacter aerilatus]|uniref:Uncharacterized protein n=1 Tax=Hymenobacter aerilatus TaxID=2932251 RepID=A0A8T9SYU2_9BACT|nr:hypothetical protein [Hymenobacter aerilatus]UOR07422.1 hypothetical protein MUN82_10055 [Hymenobacter aerilatus]